MIHVSNVKDIILINGKNSFITLVKKVFKSVVAGKTAEFCDNLQNNIEEKLTLSVTLQNKPVCISFER